MRSIQSTLPIHDILHFDVDDVDEPGEPSET